MRYGIIGAGNIAHAFSKALVGLKLDLEAVASRDLSKAMLFQSTFGFKKVYDDYESLLNDPDVDVVYVATPHSFHFEHVMMCLDHNKHVICEKPMTLNYHEALALFNKATEKSLFLMEALWTKFSPLTNHLKSNLESYIGNLHTLNIDFSFKGEFNPNNRLYNPLLGGGALLDVGIYPVAYANLFLGIPDEIDALCLMSKTGVDAQDTIIYHYKHCVSNLTASIEHEGSKEAVFLGSKGILKVPFFFAAETAYLYDLNMNLIKEITFKNQINGYEYEIIAFEEAIKQGILYSKYHTPSDTLQIMKQLDEIRERWGFRYPKERE